VRKSKSKVKLNFGLSPDFSIQLKVSLSDSLSERLSQKLKWPNVLSSLSVPSLSGLVKWLVSLILVVLVVAGLGHRVRYTIGVHCERWIEVCWKAVVKKSWCVTEINVTVANSCALKLSDVMNDCGHVISCCARALAFPAHSRVTVVMTTQPMSPHGGPVHYWVGGVSTTIQVGQVCWCRPTEINRLMTKIRLCQCDVCGWRRLVTIRTNVLPFIAVTWVSPVTIVAAVR